jgi:hypothetical protein
VTVADRERQQELIGSRAKAAFGYDNPYYIEDSKTHKNIYVFKRKTKLVNLKTRDWEIYDHNVSFDFFGD